MPRVTASLPFVEQLARRVAATMPHSIDIGDLVPGVIGLIDAAHRFDEARGIKFETFAERRIGVPRSTPFGRTHGPAACDASGESSKRRARNSAGSSVMSRHWPTWPRRLDPTRRGWGAIVRINAIESTSPLANNENLDESSLPTALIPSSRAARRSLRATGNQGARVRRITSCRPARAESVGLYYYGEATMKQIGAEIGVNESRVSQLHARAIRRLRDALGSMMPARLKRSRRCVALSWNSSASRRWRRPR